MTAQNSFNNIINVQDFKVNQQILTTDTFNIMSKSNFKKMQLIKNSIKNIFNEVI